MAQIISIGKRNQQQKYFTMLEKIKKIKSTARGQNSTKE